MSPSDRFADRLQGTVEREGGRETRDTARRGAHAREGWTDEVARRHVSGSSFARLLGPRGPEKPGTPGVCAAARPAASLLLHGALQIPNICPRKNKSPLSLTTGRASLVSNRALLNRRRITDPVASIQEPGLSRCLVPFAVPRPISVFALRGLSSPSDGKLVAPLFRDFFPTSRDFLRVGTSIGSVPFLADSLIRSWTPRSIFWNSNDFPSLPVDARYARPSGGEGGDDAYLDCL